MVDALLNHNSAPLVNDYKTAFLRRRTTEAFFGGARLRRRAGRPWKILVYQILLFLSPSLLGCICLTLHLLLPLPAIWTALLLGGLALLQDLALQLGSLAAERGKRWKRKKSGRVKDVATPGGSLASGDAFCFDDDDDDDDGDDRKPRRGVLQQLVSPKSLVVNVFFHAVVDGVVHFYAFLFLLGAEATEAAAAGAEAGYSLSAGAVAYFVIGWWPICLTHHALILRAPLEPAVFSPTDPLELRPLLRSVHALLLFLPDLVHRIVFVSSSSSSSPVPSSVLVLFRVLFLLLPFLWPLGLLPPPDSLLLWFFESLDVFALGGAATTSRWRRAASLATVAATAAIAASLSSWRGAVIVSGVVGLAASLPWAAIWTEVAPRRVRAKGLIGEGGRSISGGANSSGVTSLHLLVVVFDLVVTLILCGVLPTTHSSSSSSPTSSNSSNNTTSTLLPSSSSSALFFLVLVLFVVVVSVEEFNRVFVLTGLLRNPFFKGGVCGGGGGVGVSSPKRNKRCSFFRVFFSLFVWSALPLATLSYVAVTPGDGVLPETPSWDGVVLYVCCVRAFRRIWRSPLGASLEIIVVHIVFFPLTSSSSSSLEWAWRLKLLPLYLAAQVALRWTRNLVRKSRAVGLIVYHHLLDKKQWIPRVSLPLVLLDFTLLLPFVFFFLLLASFLSSPILPLFTLPLFLVSFPRPTQFWPEVGTVGAAPSSSSSSSIPPSDEIAIYRQMRRRVEQSVGAALSEGGLGHVTEGDHFLIRFQDRIVWLILQERGHGFYEFTYKGLELQETSCHTVEAARVDEIFESASLTDDSDDVRAKLAPNRHITNALTPLRSLEVETYSDARNVLTGIVDSHEVLRLIPRLFCFAFYWVLAHDRRRRRKEKLRKKNRNNNDNNDKGDEVVNRGGDEPSQANVEGKPSETLVEQRKTGSGIFEFEDSSGDGSKVADLVQEFSIHDWSDDDGLDQSKPPVLTTTNLRGILTTDDEDEEEMGEKIEKRDKRRNKKEERIKERKEKKEDYNLFGSVATLNSVSDEMAVLFETKKNKRRPTNESDASIVNATVEVHKSDVSCRLQDVDDDDNDHLKVFSPKNFPSSAKENNNNNNDDRNKWSIEEASEDSLEKDSDGVVASIFVNDDKDVDDSIFEEFPRIWFEDSDDDVVSDIDGAEMRSWLERIVNVLAAKEGVKLELGEETDLYSTPVTIIHDPSTPTPPDETDAAQITSSSGGANWILDGDATASRFPSLTRRCLSCLYGSTDDPVALGPKHVFKIYAGQIPWTPRLQWLMDCEKLFKIVVKSFRYAVKMAVDAAIYGGGDEVPPLDEMVEALEELEADWILGMEEEEDWRKGLVDEKPKLFAMGFDAQKNVYTSRVLTLGRQTAPVASVDPEIVHGIWATLNLELLFMANDDEERYSIQAHPEIMRNLVIQAAEPPLGYPVYQDSMTAFTL